RGTTVIAVAVLSPAMDTASRVSDTDASTPSVGYPWGRRHDNPRDTRARYPSLHAGAALCVSSPSQTGGARRRRNGHGDERPAVRWGAPSPTPTYTLRPRYRTWAEERALLRSLRPRTTVSRLDDDNAPDAF